ncbi:MAG: carboxylate--amine ligase [Halolamina sp.]
MAEQFRTTEELTAAVADADFDRPPAVVANAHITGLSVARALSRADVPVIAVDRSDDGVAPPSSAVDFAGEIAYPLDDPEGFRTDLAAVADAAGGEVVPFGCMDEWVHAFADAGDLDGVTLPFGNHEGVLDKDALYRRAEALGVPYPETYRLWETDLHAAAAELGYPLVVKPARKREFEEAVGTNVVEVDDREEFEAIVAEAREHDVQVMAQESVDVKVGADASLASYVPESGAPLSVVGNAAVRFPRGFGTSCLVETADEPTVEQGALAVIEDAGYHGISEAEFVYDRSREEYVLLDVNTRPWKWISMPVQAGANLPLAAYGDAVADADRPAGADYDPDAVGDAKWVYLRDYLELLATDEAFWDVLGGGEWRALVSGAFEDGASLTTGVYRPSDPAPTAHLLDVTFSGREYYCSC